MAASDMYGAVYKYLVDVGQAKAAKAFAKGVGKVRVQSGTRHARNHAHTRAALPRASRELAAAAGGGTCNCWCSHPVGCVCVPLWPQSADELLASESAKHNLVSAYKVYSEAVEKARSVGVACARARGGAV